MSTAEWDRPVGGAPGGPEPSPAGSRPFLKIAVALILLAALAWVLLQGAQYCRTKQTPSIIPPPAGDLFGPSFEQEYVGTIGGLNSPMGVAVGQDGRIYVTETGGERMIHVFDRQGDEVGTFAPPDTVPSKRVPVYVAVSPIGDVYVSDRDAATIYIFSADGEPKGEVAPPEGFEDWHPLGLTFDKAGNLYVTDVTPDKHRLIVLDADGDLKLSFGTQGEGDGEFWFPNGIAVDAQGRIFVADSNNGRMQAFDKDGKLLFKIGRGMSRGDLSAPRGIAIDSKNRLLIVDTYRGAVQAYSVSDSVDADADEPPVKVLGAFSGSPGDGVFFLFPNGLALDGQGKMYIADRSNDQVQIWKY